MLDLSTFDLEADAVRGATVRLLNPRNGRALAADDGSPVEIQVQGSDAPAYRAAQREVRQKIDARHVGESVPLTPEELSEHTASVLAAVTTGWRNIVVDGQPWEFNREAAAALYRRFAWIAVQVDATVTDRNRFGPDALAA
ncbi:hypothetical protein [Methylobacterium indicum]|uniref:Uncharacterized protein n=1 Tax=Methylobacterium indicum TaxID=1775910 RepID=A0A8H8X1H4_9HYPH|nr:hypothetical protein [Methylobacterium indicum]BCM88093.1 hypothetical protein mvi_65540 [Methylobacterium indicum]